MRRRQRAGVEIVDLEHIALRLHRPAAADGDLPGLLWIHGGGYVTGTATQDDPLCQHVAHELGIVVAAVDYRLAPEHPFPVPLHDCHQALVWLSRQPGVDAQRLALGGASAGGGLAAALAMLAHERGEVRPLVKLLSYPMLDDRTAIRTDLDERHARLWNNRANRFAWTSYLGRAPGASGIPPLAAPARNVDLAGLPPTWIGVGSFDILLAENLAYAEARRAAGVPCDVELIDGAFHGFDSVRPKAAITRSFRAAQVDALRRHLFPA